MCYRGFYAESDSADCNRGHHPAGRPGLLRNRYGGGDADAAPRSHVDANTYTQHSGDHHCRCPADRRGAAHVGTGSNRNTCSYSRPDSDSDARTDSHPDTNGYAATHANAISNAYGYCDACSGGYSHTCRYTAANGCPCPNCYTIAHIHTATYTHACADCYARAYRYASTYRHTYAQPAVGGDSVPGGYPGAFYFDNRP